MLRSIRSIIRIGIVGAAFAGLSASALAQPTAASAYVGPTTQATYTPIAIPDADGTLAKQPPVRVGPISDELRQNFRIPPFYTKSIVVRGMPIIGSAKVSDWAFLECGYVLDHMLADSPPRVLAALARSKVKVGIISVVEYTMDIPENQRPANMTTQAGAFQDRRSRGLGGLPLATCGEENLLNLRRDPYRAEDITIHEFSHTVASAIRRVEPEWYAQLKQTYQRAMAAGLFAHSYSATNEQEYWAEGAQAWFDCASPRKDPTVHSGIWTRDQLKAYDPDLARLLADVYGDGKWRYVRADNRPLDADGATMTRTPEELTHLAGLDRDKMPMFDFRNSPRIRAAATQPTGRAAR
jgi:hypothetical protein